MLIKKIFGTRTLQTSREYLQFNTLTARLSLYNAFNVYCRELAPSTVSLKGDRAQGDNSKHCAYSTVVPRPLSNDPRFTQCIYRYSRASKRFVEV